MANVIKLKRSETASAVPGTSDIAVGEVCMNIADQKIYTRKSDDSIITIASHASGGSTPLDGSVTTNKLADGAVTTVKLAGDAVDVTNLADNACNSEHYTNGSVDDAHIRGMAASKLTGTITPSDNTVTGAKIALGSDAAGAVMYYDGTNYVRLAKGSNGEVLTLASGVPSWAADSTNVGATSVGGDVTGTVANIQIASGAVGTTELAADAVDGTKIADDAINSEHLVNGSVDDAHISGMAASKLSGTITPSDNTVTGAKIALGSDAAGDVMYYNGTDYVRLAKGTAGQVLTINSGATAPEWAADSTNVGATSVGGDLSGTVSNAQVVANAVGITELNVSDGSNGQVLKTNGSGTLSFTTITPGVSEATATAKSVTMAIALG